MRIVVGPNAPVYDRPIKHDDVIIVPEFFCKEDGAWDLFQTCFQNEGSKRSKTPLCSSASLS